MEFFDAHCHLQDVRIFSDLNTILEDSVKNGVTRLCCCGTRPQDWSVVLETAEKHSFVTPSLGLHPWFVRDASKSALERLKHLLLRFPAAVGEAGLDGALPDRNMDEQVRVFRTQVKLAAELGRPLSVHCRRAFDRLIPILEEYCPFEPGFMIHSFSGSVELVRKIVAMGGYISFSGTLTYKGNKRVLKNLPAVPADRLLFETDSPDMLPSFAKGRSANTPANLPGIVARAAQIRDQAPEDLAAAAFANAKRLFSTVLRQVGQAPAPDSAAPEERPTDH